MILNYQAFFLQTKYNPSINSCPPAKKKKWLNDRDQPTMDFPFKTGKHSFSLPLPAASHDGFTIGNPQSKLSLQVHHVQISTTYDTEPSNFIFVYVHIYVYIYQKTVR